MAWFFAIKKRTNYPKLIPSFVYFCSCHLPALDFRLHFENFIKAYSQDSVIYQLYVGISKHLQSPVNKTKTKIRFTRVNSTLSYMLLQTKSATRRVALFLIFVLYLFSFLSYFLCFWFLFCLNFLISKFYHSTIKQNHFIDPMLYGCWIPLLEKTISSLLV